MSGNSDQALEAFARTAEAYCRWAEATPSDEIAEARTARKLLVELVLRAIDLPETPSDIEAMGSDDAEYRRIYRRFGALPFSYYSACLDPLLVPAGDAGIADLADDLADIWRDLKTGLQLWSEDARYDAAAYWHLHFEIHWGEHATSALRALQNWFTHHADKAER